MADDFRVRGGRMTPGGTNTSAVLPPPPPPAAPSSPRRPVHQVSAAVRLDGKPCLRAGVLAC